jgi:hypothetical protein
MIRLSFAPRAFLRPFRPFLALVILALLAAPPARPWGAFRGVAGIKVTDTHQQILRAAYALLLGDPCFSGMAGIPAPGGRYVPIESVVMFEGVDADPVTLKPYGPGPDAEGLTLYSCHWFNPSTGQGQGPDATADWYLRFIRAVLGLGGGDEDICKGLAWSAHFLADMFVPYHLNGMPAGDALARLASGNFILGPNESGPAYFIDPSPTADQRPPRDFVDEGFQRAGETVNAWWRRGWGPGNDFRATFEVFAANHRAAAGRPVNHLDWFDPWYWNGTPYGSVGAQLIKRGFNSLTDDLARTLFSSHATYEAIAHGRFVEGGGYQVKFGRGLPYDPLWKNALPDYAFAGTSWQSQAWQVKDFAARCAYRTLQNAELCWRQPEIAVRAAVEAVYSMWRSAYSALRPVIQAGRDPSSPNEGLLIQVIVQNHAYEACHDASVRMSVRRGGAIVSQWTQPVIGPVTLENGGRVSWFAPVDPNQEWEIVAEAVGVYDRTPDLQYGGTIGLYRPVPGDQIWPFFEQPRPVEEAQIEDFVGEYALGDPSRSSSSYSGTLTLRPDGTCSTVEIGDGNRVESEGTWSFDRSRLYFSLQSPSGGQFEGIIQGTTSDFTVTGKWSNGVAGALRVYRRR